MKLNRRNILLNLFVFLISFIIGNGIFFDELIYAPGEVTPYTLPFAITITFITVIRTVYSEGRLNNMKKNNNLLNIKNTINTLFFDKLDKSYFLNIYLIKDRYFSQEDLENYFNYNTNKYEFPNAILIKKIQVKSNQVLILNKYELFKKEEYLRQGTRIITSEYEDIEYDPNIVETILGSELRIILPSQEEFRKLREIEKELRERKEREKQTKIVFIERTKVEESIQKENERIKKEIEIRERYESLSLSGLSDMEIDRVLEFYQKEIISKNWIYKGYGFIGTEKERIDKYSDITLLETETELDLFLTKNKYILAFDPSSEEDIYLMSMKEFEILNNLGMVSQSEIPPFYVKVKDIRIRENWNNIKKNEKIKININQRESEDLLMDGYQFEEYVAGLMRNNGFINVKVTKSSGDQGVDIKAESIEGIKYVVQTKYYSGTVGNEAVQQIIAGKSYYGAHVGVVITNSSFTRSAKELAEKTGIILWDKKKLNEWENE